MNLLTNPSFGGSHHRAPQPISGEFPDGWELEWYSHDGDPAIGPTGSVQTVPELIVIQHVVQFPEDFLRYDKTDDWILKCFREARAISFGWKQIVPNVPAGRYRFKAPVFPDHWHDPGDGFLVRPSAQTSADWYLASEVFAKLGPIETGWLDARLAPIGKYTVMRVEDVHPGGDMTVRFGARGRWPFKNNCWFFDGLSLERMDEPIPAPEPLPEPVPSPQPQPGTVDAVSNSLDQLALDFGSMTMALDALTQQVRVDLANARQMVAKLKSEIAPPSE